MIKEVILPFLQSKVASREFGSISGVEARLLRFARNDDPGVGEDSQSLRSCLAMEDAGNACGRRLNVVRAGKRSEIDLSLFSFFQGMENIIRILIVREESCYYVLLVGCSSFSWLLIFMLSL